MDLLEALASAIAFEHRVRDHYAECSRKTTDPLGKRIFATMAREEQEHVAYLETRKADWLARGAIAPAQPPTGLPSSAWLNHATEKIAASGLSPVGSPGNHAIPELAFLREALELERQTAALYEDLVNQLLPSYQELFKRFMDIEDGHILLIQAEIEALVGHGRWFDFLAE